MTGIEMYALNSSRTDQWPAIGGHRSEPAPFFSGVDIVIGDGRRDFACCFQQDTGPCLVLAGAVTNKIRKTRDAQFVTETAEYDFISRV